MTAFDRVWIALGSLTVLLILSALFFKMYNMDESLHQFFHGENQLLQSSFSDSNNQIKAFVKDQSEEQKTVLLKELRNIIHEENRILTREKKSGHHAVSCAALPINIDCTKDCNHDFAAWSQEGPDLCQFINLRNIVTFNYRLGFHTREVDGGGMFAVSHADNLVLDYLLTRFKLENITELGTAGGVTSLFFGLVARTRGGTLHTYDIHDIRDSKVKRGWLDNMEFFREDILSTLNQKVIDSLTRGGPQFAFFDNGNKKHEVNVYAQYLPAGSVLSTHDWENEIVQSDIAHTLAQYGFQPIFESMAIAFRSHVRAWIKTA